MKLHCYLIVTSCEISFKLHCETSFSSFLIVYKSLQNFRVLRKYTRNISGLFIINLPLLRLESKIFQYLLFFEFFQKCISLCILITLKATSKSAENFSLSGTISIFKLFIDPSDGKSTISYSFSL